MKLILHIVRKDAARVRWLWLAWLVVLAAKLGLALCVALVGLGRLRMLPPPEPSLLILNALDGILVYLLAAWMMLEDAPMNDRHFGRTRPVPRDTLLTAKIVGALVLFWLPAVALWLPWWIYCGFTAGDICAEAGVVLAGKALAVLPAFLVASLVDSFRRLLLWTPVWLGALMIALPVPISWAIARSVGDHGISDDLEKLGLWQSRFLLAGVVLTGGAAILLVSQFFRRRPRETAAALTAGFALALTIGVGAPWNFWPDGGKWAEWHPERASGMQPEFAWARRHSFPNPKDDSWLTSLELRWRTQTASNVAFRPLRSSLEIVAKDRGPLIRSNDLWHDSYRLEDDDLVWRQMNFDSIPLRKPSETPPGARDDMRTQKRPSSENESGFSLDQTSFSTHAPRTDDGPLKLESRMLLAQLAYETTPPQAATPGVATSDRGRTVRLEKAGQYKGTVSVVGLDTRRARLTERLWAEFLLPLATRQAQDSRSSDGLALVDTWNRAQGPRMDLVWWRNRGTGPAIGGAKVQRVVLGLCPIKYTDENEKQRIEPITDEWLAGLRLVAVERRETARILREVTVDPLTITEAKDRERN